MSELTEITNERAALMAHWPTGPVPCCFEHGEKLVALGRVMGTHVMLTPYNGEEPCTNCVNEQKKARP